MDLIDIIKPLSTVLNSAVNKSQHHQEKKILGMPKIDPGLLSEKCAVLPPFQTNFPWWQDKIVFGQQLQTCFCIEVIATFENFPRTRFKLRKNFHQPWRWKPTRINKTSGTRFFNLASSGHNRIFWAVLGESCALVRNWGQEKVPNFWLRFFQKLNMQQWTTEMPLKKHFVHNKKIH